MKKHKGLCSDQNPHHLFGAFYPDKEICSCCESDGIALDGTDEYLALRKEYAEFVDKIDPNKVRSLSI